jgi:hypothetical protein
MVHCGYDPSGALGTNYQPGDHWKNFRYNFGPRPPRYPGDPDLVRRVFNGFSAGRGHLAAAREALRAAGTETGVDGRQVPQAGSACASVAGSESPVQKIRAPQP